MLVIQNDSWNVDGKNTSDKKLNWGVILNMRWETLSMWAGIK